MIHETRDDSPPWERDEADALEAARRLLGDTLAAARFEDLVVGSALHGLLARYARAARAALMPPERLLSQVKALAREHLPSSMPRWVRHKAGERVVAWTIAAYFDPMDQPPAA